MTASEWQRHAQTLLQNHSSSPMLDAQLLLCHVLELDKPQLLTKSEYALSTLELHQLNQLLDKRSSGSPIAHLLGSVEFYGLKLTITPDVLVPRPETEMLVSLAKAQVAHGLSVLDIGTGSGAIAIALKTVRPDLSLVASDNSAKALDVAKQNAVKQQVEVDFLKADLLNDVPPVDTVVANLPYLPTAQPLDSSVRREPIGALLSGEDGLDHYRALFEQLQTRPNTKQVFVEAEPEQSTKLVEIAERVGYIVQKQQAYCFYFTRD